MAECKRLTDEELAVEAAELVSRVAGEVELAASAADELAALTFAIVKLARTEKQASAVAVEALEMVTAAYLMGRLDRTEGT